MKIKSCFHFSLTVWFTFICFLLRRVEVCRRNAFITNITLYFVQFDLIIQAHFHVFRAEGMMMTRREKCKMKGEETKRENFSSLHFLFSSEIPLRCKNPHNFTVSNFPKSLNWLYCYVRWKGELILSWLVFFGSFYHFQNL